MPMTYSHFIGPIWTTTNRPEDGVKVVTGKDSEFEVEMLMRGYSVHAYTVRKVRGEWPSKREIAQMCDGISLDYFGFEANVGEDTAHVNIYVD